MTGPPVTLVPLHLVRGDDPSVIAQALRSLVDELLDGRDPALVVEEHGGPGSEDLDVGAIIDALTTPPFLVDRRVVVVREAGRMSSGQASRIVEALREPLPSTCLVLGGGGGAIPQALHKAVAQLGTVVDASIGSGRDRARWVAEQVRRSPVQLTSAASTMLTEHLGEDLGRLAGLLETLAASYGEGATLGPDELEPFLGEPGAVPPWDLTDAVDGARTETALGVLHRMVGPGGRAAPEIVAILHRHYGQMLRLDGVEGCSADKAAELLGLRSTFVAKKSLSQARRLGSGRIAQAIWLLGQADLDIKGQSALPPEVVLEVLVARLSKLASSRPPVGTRRNR